MNANNPNSGNVTGLSDKTIATEVTGTNFDDQNYRLLRGKVYLECLEQFVLNELEASAAEQEKVLILIATTIEVIDTAMSANEQMQTAFKGLFLEQNRANLAA